MKYTIYCRTKSPHTGNVSVKQIKEVSDLDKMDATMLRTRIHPENEYFAVLQSRVDMFGDLILTVIGLGNADLLDLLDIVKL